MWMREVSRLWDCVQSQISGAAVPVGQSFIVEVEDRAQTLPLGIGLAMFNMS